MSHGLRILVVLAIAMALLAPVAVAQKPPAPPPPPSAPPSRPANSPPPSSVANQPTGDLVMFLRGRVATNDGTPLPNNVLVERVCNNRVRQQLYASPHGDFSMQLGSRADSFVDASGDPGLQSGAARKDSDMGIPRGELSNCELRASASGFYPGVMNLVGDLVTLGGSLDVGAIVVQRAAKIEGMTLSATPYKAPRDARRAYEKGLEAEKNSKLANARKYFEQAVEIYPSFTNAWFQLGTVLQKQNQNDAARTAYTQATAIDTKFLRPYLSLALMAYQAENWPEVLKLTGHILDLDPFNQRPPLVTCWISIHWITPRPISITVLRITSSTRSKTLKRARSGPNTLTCALIFRTPISCWLKSPPEKTTTPWRSWKCKLIWS